MGLLAMPDGGLVFTVNGRREFLVADAAVSSDRLLYPLVQVA